MLAREVTRDDVASKMPSHAALRAWARGEAYEWPPPAPPPTTPLRFRAGDAVDVRVSGDGVWRRGEVVRLWHRMRGWPRSARVPYLVKLSLLGFPSAAASYTYVPRDTKDRVRRAEVRRRNDTTCGA